MENNRYEFGPFRLDVAERQLRREGKVLGLTPKAFDVLTLLVVNQGRLLTKEELLRRAWPETFVEESTLVQNIATLRRALGESSGERQFIETVPKVGYRFVADVKPPVVESSPVVWVEEQTSSQVVVEQTEENTSAQ